MFKLSSRTNFELARTFTTFAATLTLKNMPNINITIELLRRYSSTKRMKELLAVAIWMKMRHSNSVMWNLTAYRLRKSLCIGKAKADRIMSDINESDLFSVSGNIIKVASFRDNCLKWTKKGKQYRGAMVCKFPVKDNYTLKELYNLINERLFELPLCAAEHKDCLLDNSGAKGNAVTIKEFKAIVKMGHGSIVRLKRRLIHKGIISSTSTKRVACIHYKNESHLKNILRSIGRIGVTFSYRMFHYILSTCAYNVISRDTVKSFRHLIYGKHAETMSIPTCKSTIPQLCGF